jgi:hypothetical protein
MPGCTRIIRITKGNFIGSSPNSASGIQKSQDNPMARAKNRQGFRRFEEEIVAVAVIVFILLP